MADESPLRTGLVLICKAPLQGGDHGSYSWAQFRDSGKGKQEGLDHREARGRKKHSAKLGQKPFPSCVKNPERLGRQPEEVPCPWIQGSGRLGMLCSSSRRTGGSWEIWRGSWQPTQGSSSPTRASSHEWNNPSGIVQGSTSCPTHEVGPQKGQG